MDYSSTGELMKVVSTLRDEGEVVVTNLLADDLSVQDQKDLNCDRQLVCRDGVWVVENLN